MERVWATILMYCVLLGGVTVSAEECDDEGSLQLVGFETVGAGRIEICRNREWGTICADSLDTPWSEKNAQVACRALGYSGALNSILQNTMPDNLQVTDGSTPIHYSQVRCTGEQNSLLDCELSQSTTGCTHQRDAAIVCRPNVRAGHVCLVGDARDVVGAVELFHPQTGWTGICADPDHAPSWLRDNQAAEIVCRQLGYQGGTAYVDRLPYSSIASRDVTIDECNVDEDFALTQCATSVLTSNCSTDALAWVQCTLGNKEYGNAKREGSKREGVIQLEFNGRMGHICDTGWDSVDAEVACVEFNLDNSNTNYDTNPEGNYSKYVSDLMPIWVTDVRCTTTENTDEEGDTTVEVNENDIIDCEISTSYPVGFTDCHTHNSRDRVALVDCGTPQDPGRIAGIVLGVLSPFIIVGLVVLAIFLKKRLCDDCSCSCSWIWDGIGNCCENFCGAVSSCFSSCGRMFRPRRILRFNSTQSRPTTGTTTASLDVELTPAVIFDEPQGEPEPQSGELTEAAPPSYNEATTYTTVQDKAILPPPLPDYSFQPPPPSAVPPLADVIVPLQLPAPEPVD